MTQLLHFTLGPVQGFVAEARRTRDLWAGSFLLSWLSAHAMLAVENDKGRIRFPDVGDDPLMEALRSQGARGGNPYIGSVPNRFKAEVSDTFDPQLCTAAIRLAWERLAGEVWRTFVEPVAGLGNGTSAIWDRQVQSFWDIAWVMGSDPGDRTDGAWLDARKNWRAPYPSADQGWYEEGGDHCQLMGHFQELSGHVRARSREERGKQDVFWRQMQSQKGVGVLNLRDHERLSAIALVKRLFPLLSDPALTDVIGWIPGKDHFSVRNWPSVSYVAAAPWLIEVWDYGDDACETYRKAAEALLAAGARGESETRILGRPGDPRWRDEYKKPFFKLDGHLYHQDAIRSMPLERFKGTTGDEKRVARGKLEQAFAGLSKIVNDAAPAGRRPRNDGSVRLPPRTPSEFYAVLLADGDQIGKRLQEPGGEPAAMTGLAKFTRRVPATINRHMGVTLYAGGDDLLALLPLDTAIDAAREIRRDYSDAFNDEKWTLSAAIVLAQYKIPMRAVLDLAHRQLHDVAKKQNGRDSLAICDLKPGGPTFNWVSTWRDTVGDIDVPGHHLDLARRLQAKREFTTGFFYNVRQRYQDLFDERGYPSDTGWTAAEVEQHMTSFLEAEFRESGGKGEPIDRIAALMPVALPWQRLPARSGPERSRRFNFEAGPMMRFIAEEARWFMIRSGGGGGASTP